MVVPVEKNQYYKNIFLLGTLMWLGNVVEYFSKHSKKLVVLYLLPRWDKKNNFIQVYENGVLKKEYSLFSPKNIIIQYPTLFLQTISVILKNFRQSEHFFIITYHPYLFFIQESLKLFRKSDIVFWIVDYFPSPSLFLKLYQICINYFHKKNKHNIYLSNRLNKIMNHGKAINNFFVKTIMWGVKIPNLRRKLMGEDVWLYYNGVIREEHGLDILFKLVKEHKNIHIKLLGKCENTLFKKYNKIIQKYDIKKRVYFPNKYFTEKELFEESKKCHIAVALYSVNKHSYIYYADPGKVKLYSELGLPIIMTRSSEIAEYIKKFNAGEVIERNDKSLYTAIVKICANYSKYLDGLGRFNKYFEYEKYYKRKFAFLEVDK